MTIKKGTAGKGKGKEVAQKNEVSKSKKEVSTSSSTDLARKSSTSSIKHSTEVVSSSSHVQESKNVAESEKRTNTMETTSSSREVIMDSKGNIIKVIESKPKTVVQKASTSRSAKASQELIAGEQSQSVKESRKIQEKDDRTIDTQSHQSKIDKSRTDQSKSTGHFKSTGHSSSQSSHSESFHKSSDSSSHGLSTKVPPKTTSKSVESCESKTIVTEGHTKDGETVTSTIRINEAGQRIDDNGVVVSTTSQNIDSDIRIDKDKKSIDKHDSRRRLGDSAWDGKFVYEKPSPKGKTVDVRTDQDLSHKDHETHQSHLYHDELFSSSSSVHETHSSESVIKNQSTSSIQSTSANQSTSVNQQTDTTDFGRRDSGKSSHSPTRYTKPGDSTWDGSFVLEKQEPKKKTVSYDLRDSTHGSDTKMTDSSRFITEEKLDIKDSRIRETNIQESTRDSKSPTRRVTRPGDSTWDGHFVYEKPQEKRTNDTTVVRTTAKRNDSVEVQDVTEEQNVQESVSSSYIIEYNSAGDARQVEKVTSVSEAILEEDDGPRSPRRTTPRDQPRTYRPGESSWDGKFVYEKPFPDRKKPGDIRKVDRRSGTMDIREVTEDNSINEADISTSSYVIEHASSEQSFKDVKDHSISSLIVEVDDHRDGRKGSPRPESPEKTPKERDLRTTKPGSSAWDGTFVKDRSPEKPRSGSPDQKPGSRYPLQKPEKKKNISDTTLDLTDTEVTRSSFIVQQSKTHESYSDSQNVDFSTTAVETVVIQDGQPVISSISIIDDHPVKFITTSVIETDYNKPNGKRKPSDQKTPFERTPADKRKPTDQGRPSSPEKRGFTPEERSLRPTKPGSSTWDGSFVYEKPEPKKSEPKKPEDSKTDKPVSKSKSVDIRKHSTDIIDKSTSVDLSESRSSITVEKSSIIESKTFDSSGISRTIVVDYPEGKPVEDEKRPKKLTDGPQDKPRRPGDSRSPEGRKSPEKSPTDRSDRPTKPGSSTWDGSFTYEKPQDKKPTDDKKTTDKKPSLKKPEEKKQPKDLKPSDRRPSITKEIVSTTVKHDVIDSRDIISDTDVTVTSEVVQQSFVIEKSSSFTEVQDIRNIVEDHVISEFTKDIRQNEVSKNFFTQVSANITLICEVVEIGSRI